MSEARIKIVVDGQESIQTLNELTQNIDQFTEQVKGVDDGSESFKQFTKLVEDLTKAFEQLSLDIDTEEAQKSLQIIEDSLVEINRLNGEEIEVRVELEQGPVTLKSLREELRGLQDEIASAEFGSPQFVELTERAGALKDQIEDINKAINSQKGEAVERLGAQFRSVGESVGKLDFAKATKQLEAFNSTLKGVDFRTIGKDALAFGKSLSGTVLTAIQGIGKAILANPILLLASVIISIVAALVTFKDSIKPVQVALDGLKAIGDAVINTLKGLSDALGLSSFAAEEAAEKQKAANEAIIQSSNRLTEQLEADGKKQIAEARARGAAAEEIRQIEDETANAIIAAQQKILVGREAELESLRQKVADSVELNEEEIKSYEELTAAANEAAAAQAQIRQRQFEFDKKNQEEAAKSREKALAEQSKNLESLRQLSEKYLLSEEQRIARAAKAELDSIKGTSETARKLRAEIEAQRDRDIAEVIANRSAKEKNAELDLAEARAQLALIEAQKLAKTDEDRLQAQIQFNDKLLQIELDRLDQQRAAIKASDKLTDAEKLAQQEALKVKELQLTKNNEEEIANLRKVEAQKQFDAAIDQIEEEVDAVKKARTKLLDDFGNRVGILGFKRAKAELQAALTEELDTIQKAKADEIATLDKFRKDNKTKEEEYRKQLAAINDKYDKQSKNAVTQTNETIEDERQRKFNKTLDDLQNGLNAYIGFTQAAFEVEATKLSERQSELDTFAEQERARIESTITDETARKEALEALDKDLFNKQQQIDRQQIELQKRQIRRDRNAALAQIALSNARAIAQGLATATKAGKDGGPVAFALTLASVAASIALTIAQARRALKEADAAGAGGGPSPSVPSPPSTSTAAPSPVAPSTGESGGQNLANQQFGQSGTNTVINPVVSVIDINAAQARTEVIETRNTIN